MAVQSDERQFIAGAKCLSFCPKYSPAGGVRRLNPIDRLHFAAAVADIAYMLWQDNS